MTRLSSKQLYHNCDPALLPFSVTDEINADERIIGQDRAVNALRFGVDIRREGYNLFVQGPSGVGKHTMVRHYLEGISAGEPEPNDWCYLNNFEDPQKPRAVSLSPGRGVMLKTDMAQLIDDLQSAIPVAFETEEYHTRVAEVERAYKARRESAFREIAEEATGHNITFLRTPEGFAFAPSHEGKVLEPEEYNALPDREKAAYDRHIEELQEKLNNIIRLIPQWQRETREKIRMINNDVGMFAVGHLVDDLKQSYSEYPAVIEYLDAVQNDVIMNLGDFLSSEDAGPGGGNNQEVSFRRYRVNVLVSHNQNTGAPVIHEDSPLHQNLVGSIEHISRMGALMTDFLLIKPGALHRANGGYLIIDAHKLLMQPYAWEGLKRALRSRSVCIESLGKIYSLISTQSLEPEPIPLDLKVVLLGERILYYLMMEYDPEFRELFKVAADFEDDMDFNVDNILLYASMIAGLIKKESLLPFSRDAVARVIEQGQRTVSDQERMTTNMLSVVDLLREADYWARDGSRDRVERTDVQKAIDEKTLRHDRMRQRLHDEIIRGTLLIDTDGMRIGQVNGLFVIEAGNQSFSQPARITATTRMGEGEIIDIEREVELGGAMHSKGVMILSSFIGSRYARRRPLSLNAHLVFEQSYGMIEGDSASVGECVSLLSAIAGLPVSQSLAITGSMNQHGEVQAIGGVNEKIEGFFDICSARGLDGTHGVIIPRSNVRHLMLRSDVVAAVDRGEFVIHAVATLDEALTLLTGLEAGKQDKQGNYPEGTVNRKVMASLNEMAELRHEFSASTGRESGHGGEDDASVAEQEEKSGS